MSDGFVRAPRCIVSTDGGDCVPIDCEVSVSQHQSADTFNAKIALDGPDGIGASFWADTSPINVTVMATNDANSGGYTQMFTGQVDKVEIDFEDRTVHISGRDKTSGPLDQKTNEKWLNKQPQDIISDLAGRSGLGVNFSGQSPDRAGLKYKDDYNRISELDSHWNVIVRLSKMLGCIAFVKGSTLNIQPYDFSGGGTYTISYVPPTPENYAQGNFIKMTCGRDLNLAKDVKVNHKSWQHKEGKAIESEFESSGSGSALLLHSLKGANMTKAQQDSITKARLAEIISHERTVTIDTYGDVTIDPSMTLVVTGTGTGFDQSYVISDIEHHWSWDQGYRMNVRVRNKDSKRSGGQQNK